MFRYGTKMSPIWYKNVPEMIPDVPNIIPKCPRYDTKCYTGIVQKCPPYDTKMMEPKCSLYGNKMFQIWYQNVPDRVYQNGRKVVYEDMADSMEESPQKSESSYGEMKIADSFG